MENKQEKIYDEQISPLMTQIIEICRAHKMPMLASFFLGQDDEGDFFCTTALMNEEWGTPEQMTAARRCIQHGSSFDSAMVIKTADKDGNVKDCTVVL